MLVWVLKNVVIIHQKVPDACCEWCILKSMCGDLHLSFSYSEFLFSSDQLVFCESSVSYHSLSYLTLSWNLTTLLLLNLRATLIFAHHIKLQKFFKLKAKSSNNKFADALDRPSKVFSTLLLGFCCTTAKLVGPKSYSQPQPICLGQTAIEKTLLACCRH